ncbi:class I SAM-dependent methyltransferase [Corynebacterium sp. 13CS0277]|uniref:class I SAM-dependent methyltransferase n=1 Tax=Corynebacterium sp. 13CS0277 TaxID=2071994 RepID=UPI0011B232F8|nr:class I SAM-dependent methyltransferase [Corynebacterium sp. 13CS0277]
MPSVEFAHLAGLDPQLWPELVQVPVTRTFRAQAHAEAELARAAAAGGINLDPARAGDGVPSLVVHHDAVFARMATRGWLGFAEGFFAGEWDSAQLAEVLRLLLAAGFQPGESRVRRGHTQVPAAPRHPGGDLPWEVVSLYSPTPIPVDVAGLYASGVATTARVERPNHIGRRGAPPTIPVEVTTVQAPVAVERADLAAAQLRAVDSLLDLAWVTRGTDVLDMPATTALVALAAAERGAVVDAVCMDHDVAEAMAVQIGDVASVDVCEQVVPPRSQWRGRYEAVISAGRLEMLGSAGVTELLHGMDRLLSPGGRAAVQTTIATERFGRVREAALAPIRTYLWPAYEPQPLEGLRAAIDGRTGLRLHTEKYISSHAQLTVQLQGQLFASQERKAAAAGIDAVTRRLWRYWLAFQEALLAEGALEVVQLGIAHKPRRAPTATRVTR